MPAIVGAEQDRPLAAGLPWRDGVELHSYLVALRRFIERDQMPAMAQHADESAVPERARILAGMHQRRIDRHEAHESPIERASGPAFDAKAACSHEAVAIARTAVVEIDGMDHAVTVHRVGVGERLEQRVGAVAHIDAAEIWRDAP